MTRPRGWLWLIVASAAVGMAATVMQLIERVQLATEPAKPLLCDLNATLSCGTVLEAWQSSVFGPIPNAAIGLVVFTVMLTSAAGVLLGSTLAFRAWGVLAFLSAFMAAFTVWFLAQTTFSIHALCLYCLAIGTAVVLVNASWWRVAAAHGWLVGPSRPLAAAGRLVAGGSDLLIWAGLWTAVAAMMVIGFN
jgi:uncharacterized membrane protein